MSNTPTTIDTILDGIYEIGKWDGVNLKRAYHGGGKKEAKAQLYELVLGCVGADEKSKHVGRFQCPNYGNGCYEWAERWKMNSAPPYCSTDGRKMKYVEFDEQEGDDWVRNELRSQIKSSLATIFNTGGDNAND